MSGATGTPPAADLEAIAHRSKHGYSMFESYADGFDAAADDVEALLALVRAQAEALAAAEAENQRLRTGPLRDDEPTRLTAGEVRERAEEYEAAVAEVEHLREALAFYADPDSWRYEPDEWDIGMWEAVTDRGARARAVLGTPTGETKP